MNFEDYNNDLETIKEINKYLHEFITEYKLSKL